MKKSLIFLITFLAITTMTIPQPQNWYYPEPGDGTWRLSERYYGTPDSSEYLAKINNLALKKGPNPNWRYYDVRLGVPVLIPSVDIPEFEPQANPIQPSAPVASPKPFTWWDNRTGAELFLGLAVLCLFILLVVIITKYIGVQKEEEQSRKKWLHSASEYLLLKVENEKLQNKLPIEAPEFVNSEWLRDNNPVGNPIPNNPGPKAIERAFGKYPHLVVQAKVSTHPQSTKMEFSHDRKATTAIDRVIAYLGWDWNEKTKTWEEVGYIAGPCANGFVFTPEAIEKGMTFSRIELASPSENPVILRDTKAETRRYPEMIWPLIQEYHKLGISELKLAGMTVFAPKKKARDTKPAETSLN